MMAKGIVAGKFWGGLCKGFKYDINFCYRSFSWNDSDEKNKASVNVIIVGFSAETRKQHDIYIASSDGDERKSVSKINCYLIEGENIIIENKKYPLFTNNKMECGNYRRDGNWLYVDSAFREKLESLGLNNLYRKCVTGKNYYNGKEDYILWLKDCDEEIIKSIPDVYSRVLQCRMYRSLSSWATDYLVDNAHLLAETKEFGDYYCIPAVNSKVDPFIVRYYHKLEVPIETVFVISELSEFEYCEISSHLWQIWIESFGTELGKAKLVSKGLYNTFPFLSDDTVDNNGFCRLKKELLSIYDNAESIDKLYKSNDPHWRSVLNEINDNVYKLYGFLHEDGSRFTDDEVFAGLLKLYQKRVEELKVKG